MYKLLGRKCLYNTCNNSSVVAVLVIIHNKDSNQTEEKIIRVCPIHIGKAIELLERVQPEYFYPKEEAFKKRDKGSAEED